MNNMAKPRKPAAFIKDPLWYKDAVVYQVHLKSFYDSNNDGVGDFVGLIEKLDYIADMGVNTIWLLPFYPSPRRDDGYDIADYRGVHPEYGNMADARRFIAEAHKRGLRVITELVINHTSDQHPWFQRARKAKKGSAARNFYVWSDTDDKYQGTRIIFLDTEKSNWTWDPVAKQYFWHRFYSHQPDLNFDNPQVMKAVLAVMRFWLDMGIDGLRLDAIPYLVERDGTNNENLPETHAVLKAIRAEIDANYPDRMLLAEANQWPEDTQLYFGGEDGGPGDECHMAFHFPLMPRMYMAIAQEDRFPITDILRQTPDIPDNCQWAIFLRNHDELTLEMVTDRERDYLWNYYASDKRARINLGIRRRLAPLLERDRRRIELLNSLLLSMPGTPVIYFGGPQRRFLPRRPAEPGAAAGDGPALRLLHHQRGGAAARPAFAAELDTADAHHPQAVQGLRPRHAEDAGAEQPAHPGLSARIHRAGWPDRDHLLRGQCLAFGPGGGTGNVAVRRHGPGGDGRRQRLSTHRPAALPADAAALRVLLVPAGAHQPDAQLASGAGGDHAGLPDPGTQAPRHPDRRQSTHAGSRVAAGLSAEAALVRGQGCGNRLDPHQLLHTLRRPEPAGAAQRTLRGIGRAQRPLPVAAGLPRRV